MGHGINRILALILGLGALLMQGAMAIEPLSLDGARVQGSLEEGDSDWLPPHDPRSDESFFRDVYEINVEADQTVDFFLEAEFDAILSLYNDRSHLLVANDDFSGQFNARIATSLSNAGRYLLVVSSFLPGGTGDYTLTARNLGIGAPLPDDYLANETPIPGWPDLPLGPSSDPIEGTVTQGVLDETDFPALPAGLLNCEELDSSFPRDIYPLEGEAGTVITIDLRARFDGLLCLTAPDGRLHASNGDYSRTTHSRIADVPLTETGTWHVTVAPSPLAGAAGSYTLTISEPEPSPGFSPDTPIAFGQSVSGELTADDRAEFWAYSERFPFAYHRDGFVFEGTAGQQIQIDMTEDFQMQLYLLDPSGVEFGFADDWQIFGSVHYTTTLAQSGPHRLVITTLTAETTGEYTLSLDLGGR